MYRVLRLSNKYYGVELTDLSEDVDNITELVNTGDVVILGDTLDDIAELLEIDPTDIEIVEAEEGD